MNNRLDLPAVYMITRGQAAPETFDRTKEEILAAVRDAVECGVSLIQVREKRLSAKLLFRLTRKAAEITRDTHTRLLVNDRVDIALAARADGVHLASSSIPAYTIRKRFGAGILIGVSAHTGEDVMAAKDGDADFAVFGPVFVTPGKPDPVGLETFRSVCAKAGAFPVLALGGVGIDNYQSVMDAGASGIAAIRSLNDPISLRSIISGMKK